MGIEIPIKAAKNQLSALVREAERGRTSVITRNGKPVADIVPHIERKGGFDRAALQRWKAERGYAHVAGPAVGNFDDPFEEDVLIKPLG